jgi:multicomponent Na+:H+ antiporter subunit D
MTEHLPVLIIAVPLLAAFVLPIVRMLGVIPRDIFVFIVFIAVNVMLMSLIPDICIDNRTLHYVLGSASPSALTPEGLAFPIRIVLKIDGFSLLMAVFSAIVGLVGFLYSQKFVPEDGRKNYYVILLLLMLVGMIGLEFTNDLFNFFVFLEILSISCAALVAFRTSQKHPPYAGYKYLLISSLATSFFLLGVGLCYAQYGSFNMDYINRMLNHSLLDRIALVFMIIPLAMKAGAVPMHMWVADTYSEAPAPVTAMLVTASQASLYGVFRLSFTLFGNSTANISINYHTLGWIIIILGVLSMFIGVTMALVQHDVKRLMAFHSVSQTGYMLLGVGVGIAVYAGHDGGAAFNQYGRLAMTGGIFHIINNSMYKGLLFLTAGVMVRRFGTANLDRMIGMAHRDVFTTIAFIVGALAIAGIPPFSGFASKLIIFESVYHFNPFLSIIAMFVSVLTLASFLKVFYGAFLGPERKDLLVDNNPLPHGMNAGMGIMCLFILIMGIAPEAVIKYLIDPAIAGLVKIL